MTAQERPQAEVPSIDLEEYSASKTLVPFDQQSSTSRSPRKAGSPADRFILLAFKRPHLLGLCIQGLEARCEKDVKWRLVLEKQQRASAMNLRSRSAFQAFRDARIAVKSLSPKRPWLEFKAQLSVCAKEIDILGSDDTEINEC
ncbi:hypothetical protein HAX54_019847 [Datura stramonium]|uniref:Uncharacterized protein n=1 Tax=Datura stramonium TaxID=4076 RepID=A0ABS8UQS2_DATST|nr:hypothetical protein [Datura stramonium]